MIIKYYLKHLSYKLTCFLALKRNDAYIRANRKSVNKMIRNWDKKNKEVKQNKEDENADYPDYPDVGYW